jgi:hypothetical protein
MNIFSSGGALATHRLLCAAAIPWRRRVPARRQADQCGEKTFIHELMNVDGIGLAPHVARKNRHP